MTRLPVLSGAEPIRLLGRLGYAIDRQSGSHVVLRHTHPPHRRLTIPLHRTVAKGTLRAILRHAAVTIEQLLAGR